jgi:excisionase family DNA binding protein
MSETIAPRTVRPHVAARMTGLSRTVIFDLIRQKKLASRKVGKARLIDVASLEALVRGGEAGS